MLAWLAAQIQKLDPEFVLGFQVLQRPDSCILPARYQIAGFLKVSKQGSGFRRGVYSRAAGGYSPLPIS